MLTSMQKLRKIIKTALLEGRAEDFKEKINRNKPYIFSDASLYYWLQQNRGRMSINVDHYSMDPIKMPEIVIELIEQNTFLKGFRCVGTIDTWMGPYQIFLFSNEDEYKVVCRHYKTGGLIVADDIPRSDEQFLVEITKYMAKQTSGNAELDSHISKY